MSVGAGFAQLDCLGPNRVVKSDDNIDQGVKLRALSRSENLKALTSKNYDYRTVTFLYLQMGSLLFSTLQKNKKAASLYLWFAASYI
jgi:hypothetical protein